MEMELLKNMGATSILPRGADEPIADVHRKQRFAREDGRYGDAAWQSLRLFTYDKLDERSANLKDSDYIPLYQREGFDQVSLRLSMLTKEITKWCIKEGFLPERFPDAETAHSNAQQHVHLRVPRRGNMVRRAMQMASEVGLQQLKPRPAAADIQEALQNAISPKLDAFVNHLEKAGLCDSSMLERQEMLDMLALAIKDDVYAGINAPTQGRSRG